MNWLEKLNRKYSVSFEEMKSLIGFGIISFKTVRITIMNAESDAYVVKRLESEGTSFMNAIFEILCRVLFG